MWPRRARAVREVSFFLSVPKIPVQVFGPLLAVGFRANRQQNLADLRDAPCLLISDLLKALLKFA